MTDTLPRPVNVRPLARHRLWLEYDDGVQGEVDLSDLAGRGVFRAWDEDACFESVQLGPRGELLWEGELDLCPQALYLRLTGKRPSELFPALDQAGVDA